MRRRLRPLSPLFASLLASITLTPGLSGCGDPTLVGEPGDTGSPTAALSLSITTGTAPVDVVLDASASAAFLDDGVLKFAFDVDGDGEFETDNGDDPTFDATFSTGGEHHPAVRVSGSDGRFDIAEATILLDAANPPRTADIDVDSDKDGVISASDDGLEETQLAPFFANVDDDDGDGERDRDTAIATDADMTDVLVRRVTGLDGAHVSVAITPSIARERTVLWQGNVIKSSADVSKGEITGVDVGDVTLRLEAMTGRTSDWDGRLTITVTVENDGGVISTDVVNMRAVPIVFPNNLQAPKHLYVMDVTSGEDNNQALIDALRTLPTGVELTKLSDDRFQYDRWVQDNWEVGTQIMPAKDGAITEMITAIQLQRPGYGFGASLENFVPEQWLSAGRGFFYPGGQDSSHNYGGNLEVSPPTTQWPLGRMIYGGGDTTLSGRRNVDTMNDEQVAFLDAQEVQGPALMLSSEWLAVGHVDEWFQVVPDLEPENPAKPFKIAIASPAMAREVLETLRADGQGSATIFAGRRARTTVDDVLDDEDFNALNEAAQQRIDEQQAIMIAELGLTVDDFRPVPVMFEEIDSGLVAAFNPGIQNLVTVGDRLFVPDPEGPVVGGTDVWQQATLESLADTELDLIFVDVFSSYHELMGEAHCGTNLEREAPATRWWTVEQ